MIFNFNYQDKQVTLSGGHLIQLLKIAMIVVDDELINHTRDQLDKKTQIIINLLRTSARTKNNAVFLKVCNKLMEEKDVVKTMMFFGMFITRIDKLGSMEAMFDNKEKLLSGTYVKYMDLLKTLNTFCEVAPVLANKKTLTVRL